IETMGGVMTRMIESNTTIPTKKTETFSTAMDNQPSVEIHILQGERPMANDNKTIGKFILDSIPPSPRGVPQIEVTFDIDANGILSVHAKDKATGKEQKIRIEASSGLSKEDIEKMKKDAEMNAESDAKRKDEADKVNAADALVFSTEKQITEYGDKIPAEKKSTIESALGELKKAIGEKDFAAMETASAALNAAWQAASQDMYNATGGNPEGGDPGAGNGNGGGNGAGNGSTGDQVQDVDFEEVK
ncbi:MAG: Hsp70 family protein, partial [Bacteroidota bacterium]